jgi:hypothetical protein
MSRASKYIYNFLDNYPCSYNNRQGIEFVVNVDDSVIVNYVMKDLPLSAYFEFGLCYTSNDFNDFMRDFDFTGTQQLKALSPDRLWELYYKGQAQFYCIFAGKTVYIALYFRLAGNKMIVSDDHDNEYELGELLQTPSEFVTYTQQQFLLNKK